MNKPNNYDNISLHADPIVLGGHYAIINKVTEGQSKSGKPQITIYIDFDQQDAQPGYFKKLFDSNDRADKKWSAAGTFYITLGSNEEYYNRSIKQFVTAFEDSNGVQCVWGDKWAGQFANRKIGVVYGEEEWFDKNADEIKTSRKIRYFCDVHKALEQDVPKKRYYKGDLATSTANMAATASEDNAFMDFSNADDGDFPFR